MRVPVFLTVIKREKLILPEKQKTIATTKIDIRISVDEAQGEN